MLECSYFVAYSTDNELRFAPSIFVGYIDNNLNRHDSFKEKHGTKTKNTISRLLKCEPFPDKKLFEQYYEYCGKINIERRESGVCNQAKKFWNKILKENDA
jgi:5-methylcytosine-specific restriction protein A